MQRPERARFERNNAHDENGENRPDQQSRDCIAPLYRAGAGNFGGSGTDRTNHHVTPVVILLYSFSRNGHGGSFCRLGRKNSRSLVVRSHGSASQLPRNDRFLDYRVGGGILSEPEGALIVQRADGPAGVPPYPRLAWHRRR